MSLEKISVARPIARGAGWFLAFVITALSLVSPDLRPETGVPHHLEHFAIFFAAGLAFGVGYNRRPAVTALALVIFAATLELAQMYVPGRHARLSDFVVDALALLIGAGPGFVGAARLLPKDAQ